MCNDFCVWYSIIALVNLALRKSSRQSSAYKNYYANRGNDGNTDTDLGDGSCFHTDDNNHEPQWWSVDLGVQATVYQVTTQH